MNWLIVVAGGNGYRMKTKANKIFLPILKKPLLFYTLKTLENCPFVNKIILSVQSKDRKRFAKIISQYHFQKIVKILPAASTRQDSTWKVLQWLRPRAKPADLVAIHNAANPLVTCAEIKAVFAAAAKHGAALLAQPARDTVKIADEKQVVRQTPLRQFVWYAQTPQVGRFSLLYCAFQKAQKQKFQGTDDAQLLERSGVCVKIVPCSPENFKITYPADLFLAARILQERKSFP